MTLISSDPVNVPILLVTHGFDNTIIFALCHIHSPYGKKIEKRETQT
jgi:hypothetical protein